MARLHWDYNIWTGDYIANCGENARIIRLAGYAPPYLYVAEDWRDTFNVTRSPVGSLQSVRKWLKASGL